MSRVNKTKPRPTKVMGGHAHVEHPRHPLAHSRARRRSPPQDHTAERENTPLQLSNNMAVAPASTSLSARVASFAPHTVVARRCPSKPRSSRAAARIHASSSAAAVEDEKQQDPSYSSVAEETPPSFSPSSPRLACPICLQPFGGASSCYCASCRREFPSKNRYFELTLDAGGASGAYREPQRSGTRLFQSDVISSVCKAVQVDYIMLTPS